MAEEYFDPDVVVDSEELAEDQFAYVESGFPGWVPAAGNLDTWILEAGARLGSEVAALVLTVTSEIWRVFGEQVYRLMPVDSRPATALSTWTLGDDDGHLIEAGTVVGVDDQPFEVVLDVNVPSGETVATDVQLVATNPGVDGNDLSEPVELAETLGFDAEIVLTAPTSGGADGEDSDVYANRLARELELAAPRPLSVRDVEMFSLRVLGVERVAVLDNYKPPSSPGGEDDDVPLTFTVVGIDESGLAISPGVTAALLDLLQLHRGTNWNIYSMDPTYTTIDVNATVVPYRDFDPSDMESRTEQAIRDFLSPQTWGMPMFGDRPRWVNTPEVRHRELAAAIDRIEGMDYVPTLEFGIQDDPTVFTENEDITLPGVVPLPLAGDISVTVETP